MLQLRPTCECCNKALPPESIDARTSLNMTPSAVTVRPLARCRELIPLLAEWFISEWPNWYGADGPGNVAADLAAFAASESSLPIGMVVFENQKPIGAGALKVESIPSHSHWGPWAAAGYVLPACRGRGLGALLLQSLVTKAHELGYAQVFCGTSTAHGLLSRAGWSPVETTLMQGRPLTIYRTGTAMP